ncbi:MULTISPECIES: gp58-like family protein [Acinetobacter]|uniref:gp58-like family protein n=1 Tax=Acinetobacter TaxID=469 RepID=UPI001E610897|nr:gp58-like family protein [Acinetobacter sp. MYb10]
MDKLIIEFNKKFDKQKQELIDGFKALGEEKRLPKALATIEGEQPTYKNYFKAGWQSRQAEVDFLKAQLGLKRDQIKGFESEIKKTWQALEEKDKRIEELESAIKHLSGAIHKSISYEHDLFDKGWNECAERVVEDIYRLTGIGKGMRGEHEA